MTYRIRDKKVGRPGGRQRGVNVLVGAAVAACVLAAPNLAQASPRPGPLAAGASSPLCTGVTGSQVSQIVGRTVPNATSSTTNNFFDKKLDIHEDETDCSYNSATSAASLDLVDLFYGKLSKAPSHSIGIAEIKAGFAKAAKDLPKGSKISYSINNQFGVTSIWTKISAAEGTTSFTLEEAVGLKGTKVAGALVESALAQSKVQDLEKLALDNDGI